MIDEKYLSIVPILLGKGVRRFKDGRPEQFLTLFIVKQYKKGLVQLRYKINGN